MRHTAPYVIITPARNAARHIDCVLKSMQSQFAAPLKWVVVNDGSTDDTRGILELWKERCEFLEILDADSREERNFASKVYAFRQGLAHVQDVPYRFIGNLDADMSLEPDYYDRLLEAFDSDAQLGIASGVYLDEQPDGTSASVPIPPDYAPGALQLFRRECFEAIGGYPALRVGGIDTAAVLMAKMKGWRVRSFPQLQAIHHGRKEMTFSQVLRTRYREGMRDYGLGMHPAYAAAKGLKRLLRERPLLIGSMFRWGGFLRGWLGRGERQLPADLLAFVKREELAKLRSMGRPATLSTKRN